MKNSKEELEKARGHLAMINPMKNKVNVVKY